jgi:hypothetical protein
MIDNSRGPRSLKIEKQAGSVRLVVAAMLPLIAGNDHDTVAIPLQPRVLSVLSVLGVGPDRRNSARCTAEKSECVISGGDSRFGINFSSGNENRIES